MFNRPPRQSIDPETAGVEPLMSSGIAIMVAGGDRGRGQFAGTQRVINPVARERLDDARSIADQKQTGPARRECGPGERRNRPPVMLGRNRELLLRPASDRRQIV